MRGLFPTDPAVWKRLQAFANLLQGYSNVLAEVQTSASQAPNIEIEARKLDLLDAQLLPGWTVMHIPALVYRDDTGEPCRRKGVDKPPVWIARGPMHKRRDMPWADTPGFSGSRERVLAYLANHWLEDYRQRLEGLQLAIEETRAEAAEAAKAKAAPSPARSSEKVDAFKAKTKRRPARSAPAVEDSVRKKKQTAARQSKKAAKKKATKKKAKKR